MTLNAAHAVIALPGERQRHTFLWITVAIVLSLWMLPHIKGMLIGLQWALYMHGFDPRVEDPDAMPEGYLTVDRT